MRHFVVTGREMREKRAYNFRFSTVCNSLERACALAKAHRPDREILAVVDQGAIDKVDVE